MSAKLMFNYLIAVLLAFGLYGCGGGQQGSQEVDTPTKGEITIGVDETYRMLGEQLAKTYMGIYHDAKINVRFVSEAEGFKLLMADSIRLFLTGRDMKPYEKQTFDNRQKFPRNFHVATDGLALILNPQNNDTTLTLAQVKDIVSGRVRRWSQLFPDWAQTANDSIIMVVDQEGSGTTAYLRDSILKGAKLPANVFAAKSFPDMIDQVSKRKGAIGFISLPWITDPTDSTVLSFNRKIRVAWIKKNAESEAARPYQLSMVQKLYPLLRKVNIILVEPRNGLGTGFAAFACEQNKGQMIVHKMAMVPARGVYRLVEVTTQDPRDSAATE
jgi:phosphate transport system substrate-binding protein